MRRNINAILAALALLMIGGTAQAHDDPAFPHHKHALEIDRSKGMQEGLTCTSDGRVTVHFRKATGMCGGQYSNECAYTCLYQVWAWWKAADGYHGTDTEPGRGGYYRCHIANSWDPTRAEANFRVSKPAWGMGAWGVYVRGPQFAECRVN